MEENFETLWLRYKRPIFGYLLAHARQPADAEDLLQIVAYKALKHFSSLRNPAKFYSWIHAIAKHVVADYHRAAVPEPVSLADKPNLLITPDIANDSLTDIIILDFLMTLPRNGHPLCIFTCIITKSRRIWRKNYVCVFLRYPNAYIG